MELICVLLFLAAAIFLTYPILKDQNKELKLQISPDAASNFNIKGDFCYRINTDPLSVRNKLCNRSASDNLDFYFDPLELIITFRYMDKKVKYQLCFLTINEQRYLHLKKIYIFSSTIFTHLINDFWHNEIGAEPLPYDKFEELCTKQK